jgi:hypothetical protein
MTYHERNSKNMAEKTFHVRQLSGDSLLITGSARSCGNGKGNTAFSCSRFGRSCAFLLLVSFVLGFRNDHEITQTFALTRREDAQYIPKELGHANWSSDTAPHPETSVARDEPNICFITSQFVSSPENADNLLNLRTAVPKLANAPSVNFFAFTNVKGLKAPGWSIILKDFGTQFSRFITQSRWPKFQAHHDSVIQEHCAVIFYMDGSVILKDSLEAFQQEARRILESNVQLSQNKHYRLNLTIEKEFLRILSARKDIKENVEKSIEWLQSQPDYKSECQMYANTHFGYALNSSAFRTTADFFWSHYSKEEDSWRDQPLWCYSLHHTGTIPLNLPNRLFHVEQGRKGMNGHLYSSQTNKEVQIAARKKERANAGIFNILCTSSMQQATKYGSYQLRCKDFSSWTKKCAPNVNMTTDVTIGEILSSTQPVDFDATLFIKEAPAGYTTQTFPLEFGKIYVDVIDNYRLKERQVNGDFTVILQANWQKENFMHHKHKVVEHWYNSYPADMERGNDEPEFVPRISNDISQELHFTTVWNPVKIRKEGTCPQLGDVKNVTYDCIEQEIEIEDWYTKIVNKSDAAKEVTETMRDPTLGRGKLYYNLFHRYDVMVVLTKNNLEKLRYGNVQGVVSQMRSGVPVLLEVRGAVLELFMDKYNYKCAFQRLQDYPEYHAEYKSPYMTFVEAVEWMKDPEMRRQCQERGLEIANDYSRNVIGKKFLKALGYEGEFQC